MHSFSKKEDLVPEVYSTSANKGDGVEKFYSGLNELLKLMQIPVLNCHQPSDLDDIGSLVQHARVAESPVAILIDFQLMEEES